jgi:hypothetical protein
VRDAYDVAATMLDLEPFDHPPYPFVDICKALTTRCAFLRMEIPEANERVGAASGVLVVRNTVQLAEVLLPEVGLYDRLGYSKARRANRLRGLRGATELRHGPDGISRQARRKRDEGSAIARVAVRIGVAVDLVGKMGNRRVPDPPEACRSARHCVICNGVVSRSAAASSANTTTPPQNEPTRLPVVDGRVDMDDGGGPSEGAAPARPARQGRDKLRCSVEPTVRTSSPFHCSSSRHRVTCALPGDPILIEIDPFAVPFRRSMITGQFLRLLMECCLLRLGVGDGCRTHCPSSVSTSISISAPVRTSSTRIDAPLNRRPRILGGRMIALLAAFASISRRIPCEVFAIHAPEGESKIGILVMYSRASEVRWARSARPCHTRGT